jgi:peptide/nickel transport system substrate-binding protein
MRWGLHVTLVSRWLDPAETEAFSTPFMVMYAIHDAMVRPMPAGLNTPSLAESWTEAKDHLSYTFTLRKGVKFHNGEPVTAEDVKFSWDRYKGASSKLLKDKVKEVQIPSPSQVRFVLREPWPDFITFYGTTASGAGWIVPKKYVEKVGDDGFKAAPIGAGPYKVVSFKPGVELVSGLRRVPAQGPSAAPGHVLMPETTRPRSRRARSTSRTSCPVRRRTRFKTPAFVWPRL